MKNLLFIFTNESSLSASAEARDRQLWFEGLGPMKDLPVSSMYMLRITFESLNWLKQYPAVSHVSLTFLTSRQQRKLEFK